MTLRPPSSTRTDILFPDTTLVRSDGESAGVERAEQRSQKDAGADPGSSVNSGAQDLLLGPGRTEGRQSGQGQRANPERSGGEGQRPPEAKGARSEEHTSELKSLMRISYAVFCLKKKKEQRTKMRMQCK